MPGRTSAPYAPPTALSHSRIRPVGRSSATRGVVAAVVAATALLLAANAGPARAADAPPAPTAARQADW